MHDLRTGVYPDVRFTQEVFSFEQLRTKEKQLLTQFNKTGKYSFLNLGNFQNVCILRRGRAPTEKRTTTFKNWSPL